MLRRITVRPYREYAVLRIRFERGAISAFGVDRVSIRNADGDLLYQIPLVDRREYAVNLGPRPTHGRYFVGAESADGAIVAEATVEFNCFVDAATPRSRPSSPNGDRGEGGRDDGRGEGGSRPDGRRRREKS